MQEYASSLKGEQVRVDNFVRFSSIYTSVHTLLRGEEPFAIKIRRAYNRHTQRTTAKTVNAAELALALAEEL